LSPVPLFGYEQLHLKLQEGTHLPWYLYTACMHPVCIPPNIPSSFRLLRTLHSPVPSHSYPSTCHTPPAPQPDTHVRPVATTSPLPDLSSKNLLDQLRRQVYRRAHHIASHPANTRASKLNCCRQVRLLLPTRSTTNHPTVLAKEIIHRHGVVVFCGIDARAGERASARG
jgi:hypothetical protein